MNYRIEKVNENVLNESRNLWESIAKPIEGLGIMEKLITRIAGVQNNINVNIDKKAVVVFCADNGVVKQNVSQVDSSVTANIVRSINGGTSSVAVMAKSAGAHVFVYDVGVLSDEEDVINCKLMYGTEDISEGPAMSREVAIATIENGITAINRLKEEGYNLIATGEAGIGNTTTSAAVAGALLGLKASEVTGKGSGLSDEAYYHKIDIVEKAWKVNNINEFSDVIDVISKVGGLDIAALTGAYIGAAMNHIPIIMDGIISAVAALCAFYINENVRDYIIPSHMSMEPAMIKICEKLELDPVIHANMHLGEGTGAVLLMPMLDTVMAVYNSGTTFEKINVEQYERFEQE